MERKHKVRFYNMNSFFDFMKNKSLNFVFLTIRAIKSINQQEINNYQDNLGSEIILKYGDSPNASKSFHSAVSVPLTNQQWEAMQANSNVRKTVEGVLEEVAMKDRLKDQKIEDLEQKNEKLKQENEELQQRMRQGFHCCQGMNCIIV